MSHGDNVEDTLETIRLLGEPMITKIAPTRCTHYPIPPARWVAVGEKDGERYLILR
jgi:hypothetical protein